MGEHILETRMDALEQDLKSMQEAVSHLRGMEWRQIRFEEPVWAGLDGAMAQAVEECNRDLEGLRLELRRQRSDVDASSPGTNPSGLSVWQRYTNLAQQSRGVFHEYLEIVTGMVYRDRGFDQRICAVADEVVRSCALDSSGEQWQSMTVLAQREALNKTFALLVRLRFPGGQIWTLPLVAHEFGHVLLRESRVTHLRTFLEAKLNERVGNDPEMKRLRSSRAITAGEKSRLQVVRRREVADELYVLLADAYATYTLGYAYACAAIQFRFDTIDTATRHASCPSDDARAHVVLRVLEWLDTNQGKHHPYQRHVNMLKADWSAFIARVEPPIDTRIDRQELDKLVDDTLGMFRFLRPTASYPYSGAGEGWLVALEWSDKWTKAIEAGARPSPPELSSEHRLRDVLTAVWLARTEVGTPTPTNLRELAEAALATCEAMLKKKEDLRLAERGVQHSPQAPAQPARK